MPFNINVAIAVLKTGVTNSIKSELMKYKVDAEVDVLSQDPKVLAELKKIPDHRVQQLKFLKVTMDRLPNASILASRRLLGAIIHVTRAIKHEYAMTSPENSTLYKSLVTVLGFTKDNMPTSEDKLAMSNSLLDFLRNQIFDVNVDTTFSPTVKASCPYDVTSKSSPVMGYVKELTEIVSTLRTKVEKKAVTTLKADNQAKLDAANPDHGSSLMSMIFGRKKPATAAAAANPAEDEDEDHSAAGAKSDSKSAPQPAAAAATTKAKSAKVDGAAQVSTAKPATAKPDAAATATAAAPAKSHQKRAWAASMYGGSAAKAAASAATAAAALAAVSETAAAPAK